MESLLKTLGEWMEKNPEAIPPEIRAHIVAGREPVPVPESTLVPDDPTGFFSQNSLSDSDSVNTPSIRASTSPERSPSSEADHLANHKGENIITIVVEILFRAS